MSDVLPFVALGSGHILLGLDHLPFLLALLIAAGTVPRAAGLVTVFSLAR